MRLPLPSALVRLIGTPVLNTLARSWNYRTFGEERWQKIVDGQEPFIFMLWHEAMLPLLWSHQQQGIAIVVSQGREGKYIGDYAGRLGYHLLPGSSTKGGARALLGAIRALEGGRAVAITPDGPKGPPRTVKPGVVQAAQRTGAPIVPLHATTEKAWRAKSWDQLVVPKPGARILVGYGDPVRIPQGADNLDAGVEDCLAAMVSLEAGMASA